MHALMWQFLCIEHAHRGDAIENYLLFGLEKNIGNVIIFSLFFFAEIVRVGDCLLFAVCCAQRKSKVAKWSEFAKNCEETWRKTKTEIDRFVYSARNCVWVSYTDSELLWVYYSIRWTDEWYRKCDDNAYAVWLEEPAVRFIRRYNAQLQFGFSTKCRSNYV